MIQIKKYFWRSLFLILEQNIVRLFVVMMNLIFHVIILNWLLTHGHGGFLLTYWELFEVDENMKYESG